MKKKFSTAARIARKIAAIPAHVLPPISPTHVPIEQHADDDVDHAPDGRVQVERVVRATTKKSSLKTAVSPAMIWKIPMRPSIDAAKVITHRPAGRLGLAGGTALI